ncbi:MAG: molybdopterin-dependent oxidoreductase [Quisquiliibacterium sp.]
MSAQPASTQGFQTVPSVCPHDCTSTCALEVERVDARTIGRVRGSQRNYYTAGVICEKVARYAERVHHPDRLTQPMRRVGPKGSGQFAPVSWADALDIVAEQFTRKAQAHGTETVWPYYYAGTMGLVQRDGINRLRHAMKYSRWHSTICVALSDGGWIAGTGAKRGVDMAEAGQHADLIVIWGGNPVNTQVNVMTHAMLAKKRGATLVVVDPYRTGTAERADLHIAPRPGTDGALAVAMMHVLFAEGFADWDYLRRYTDAPDELAAHVAKRTPQWAQEITGLPAQTIIDFARLYGRASVPFIRCHHGFSRSRNGAVNMHAVSCLPAVTGAWQHKGGGALYGQTGLYPLDRSLIEGTDLIDKSIRDLDQSRLGPILVGEADALKGGAPVTAMLVQNTNPAVVCPDLHKVHQGLSREDLFLCVHEQFMTETAAFADIVLPATMFLEHDDFYTASGHTVFQVAGKVIEAPGECRENHFVICELANRLGSEHPGFKLSAWQIALCRSSRPIIWTGLPGPTASFASSPTGRAWASAAVRCQRCRITSTSSTTLAKSARSG